MSAFHALNFCLQKCPVNMFVYDHQCVEVCPKDAPYVFKSKCISQCPTTDVYQRKLFKNERVVAVECLSDCAEYSFLKHGNQCIETCSSSLFQFEGECVDICPDNVSFIYSTSYNGKLTRECKQACPHWTYYFNGTCVDSCPPNYLIYNNSLCVEKCPNDAFYTSSYHRNSFYDERRFDCVADCHPYYIFNDSCLLTCPEETVLVNTTCSQSCPNSAPYMCDETKEVLCRENRESNSWFGGIYRYNTPRQMNYVKRCSIKCPEKMLVDGFRCINQCSDSKKFFNNSCLNDCPKEFPYIKGRNECVSECPAKSYVENSVCVEHCSGDLFAVEDHRMCMSSCPLSKYVIKEKFCLIQCPSPLFNDSGTCAGSCISKFAINNTCVQKCPESHPLYLSAEPWNYHPGTWKCVSECPEHWFTFNGTCIQRCQQKIGPNRTCVSECPASHPFSKKTGYSDVEWHCLISCPDNWLSNNGICVRDCPQKLYLNKTCISKCPVSHPYFSEELRTYSQQSCADKCGFDECLLNKTCIKLTSLENAVIFHGKCLQECPGGYVWLYVSTHLTEGSEAACTSVIFLSLILIGFVFLSVFWMFCCWRFSSTSDSGSRVLKYVFLEPCDRQVCYHSFLIIYMNML